MNTDIKISKPTNLQDSLFEGKKIYKDLSNKVEKSFTYIDEVISLYFGLVIWFLKSLQDKTEVDLLNFESFKSFVNIEIQDLPIILTFSQKEIENTNVIPSELIFNNRNSIIKYIISGVSSIFKGIENNSDAFTMNVFSKEVEENLDLIKSKMKIIYLKNEDALFDEIKILKLWIKAYN
ncbi:hypothetical protein CMT75_18685 [Elizabethkingia anophelis]|nr:hypothetical protein [Elizabethkingia anophelis]